MLRRVKSMTMPEDKVEDSRRIIEVLQHNDEEMLIIKKMQELQEEIQEVIKKQQALMKKDISIVEEEKKQLSGNVERVKYDRKENALKLQMQTAKEHKEKIKQECEAVQQEMLTCEKQSQKLVEEREAVEDNTTRVLPAIRYDMNMCSMICRIRWQYDIGQDEIRGYVTNKKDVRPFSLNAKQQSQFFITNYLWDMVEAGVDIW